MSDLYELIASKLGIPVSTATSLSLSLIYFVSIWAVRYLLLKLVFMRSESPATRYTARKATLYLAGATTVVVLVMIWFDDISTLSFATYFGLLSAGIAVALKDMFSNLAGWLYIITRRPLEVGDRIEINGRIGDVIDIAAFEFVLLEIGNWVPADQSTGRLLYIPNGMVFNHPLYNYTKGFGFIWENISVTVTFESDWRKTKQILLKIVNDRANEFVQQAEEDVKRATANYFVTWKNMTPIVYTSVLAYGVDLSVRYVVPPRMRRLMSQTIWEEVLTEFAKHDDIDFAYPTYRAYLNASEGKVGARASVTPPGWPDITSPATPPQPPA